jgi:hypothetical protein
MPVRATVDQSSLIGVETTEGVTPTAGIRTRLLSIGFNLMEQAEFDEIQPMGIRVPTGTPMRQNWSTFQVSDGAYPDYNALAYLFTMLFGPASIVTAGAVAGEWTWTPGPSALTRSTFSARKGTSTLLGVAGTAEQSLGNVLTDLGLSFSRTSQQKLTGAGFGQALDYSASIDVNEVVTLTGTGTISGGTYTISFGGQTTSALAFGANAATIQTAFQLLSTVGSGNATISGGPISATPVVITFAGTLANTNVGAVTANAGSLTGSTPGITVTVTAQGAPTDVALVPVLAGEVDVFLDNTWAGLGTTKLTSDFSADWSIGKMYNPEWVLNSALASYKEAVPQRPDTSLKLELGNDAVSRALVADMRAGTTKFNRIRAMKSANSIESGQAYELRIDSAMAINSAPSAGDVDGASTLPFGGRIIYDGTGSAWTRVFLRNALRSL